LTRKASIENKDQAVNEINMTMFGRPKNNENLHCQKVYMKPSSTLTRFQHVH
jgi:hypothetical protein